LGFLSRRNSHAGRRAGRSHYLPNYHAASDTFDKVDIRELKINTALAAVTAWGIADRPEPLGKRLSRIETERLLKEMHLDEKWSNSLLGALAKGYEEAANRKEEWPRRHRIAE